MSGRFPQKWFIELDEKKMGPFSPEQVLGLLSDGEIPESLTVTPASESGIADSSRGMTAAEMREAYFQDDRVPIAKVSHETTPSIPAALEEPDHEAAKNLATSRRLFDLFQTARERRTKFLPSSTEDLSKESNSTFSIAKLLRKPAVIGVLSTSIVAVAAIKLMKKPEVSPQNLENTQIQSNLDQEVEKAPIQAETSSSPHSLNRADNSQKEEKIANTWKPSSRPAPKETKPFQRSGGVARSLPARPATPPPSNQPNWAENPRGNEWNNNGNPNTQPYQPPEGQPPPQGWDPNAGYNAGGPPPGGYNSGGYNAGGPPPGGYNSGGYNNGAASDGQGYNGYPEGGPPPGQPGQPPDQMPRDPNQDPYAQPQQNY